MGLPADEQQELFFLRMEKAVADGVEKGITRHLEVEHKALCARMEVAEKRINSAHNRILGATAFAGGVTALWHFLTNAK